MMIVWIDSSANHITGPLIILYSNPCW